MESKLKTDVSKYGLQAKEPFTSELAETLRELVENGTVLGKAQDIQTLVEKGFVKLGVEAPFVPTALGTAVHYYNRGYADAVVNSSESLAAKMFTALRHRMITIFDKEWDNWYSKEISLHRSLGGGEDISVARLM